MNNFLFVIFGMMVFLPACTNTEKIKQTNTTQSVESKTNWVGVYRGVLPCADCEGIQTMLHLKKDLTYVKSIQYQGRSSDLITQNGSFQWNREGTILTLMPWEKEEISDETTAGAKGKEQEKEMYRLGENELLMLDHQGKRIEGTLAQKYVLKKYDYDKDIREKYWRLITLYGKPITESENQKREAHFVLRSKDKRVLGHGGCNAFSGSYELFEGNRIQFSPLASTQMACAEINHESDFFKAIQSADNYIIKGDTLILTKGKMAPMMRLVAVYFR